MSLWLEGCPESHCRRRRDAISQGALTLMSPLTLEIPVMPESCTSTKQTASLDETAQPRGDKWPIWVET